MLTSNKCGNLRPNVNISEAELRTVKSFPCLYVRDYYELQMISYNRLNIYPERDMFHMGNNYKKLIRRVFHMCP